MSDLWKRVLDLVAQLEQSAPGGETLESVRQAKTMLAGFVAIAKKGEDWGDPSPLVTVREAARMLGGISRNTIYRMIRRFFLLSVKIGPRRFITRESILTYLEHPMHQLLWGTRIYRGRENWRTRSRNAEQRPVQMSA